MKKSTPYCAALRAVFALVWVVGLAAVAPSVAYAGPSGNPLHILGNYMPPAAVIIDPNNGTATVTVAYSQSTAGVQFTYTESGNGSFTLTMPGGVTYIPGSFTFISSAGAVIAEQDVTDRTAPVFSITGATVGANSVITYGIAANCATQGSASMGVSVTVGSSTDTGTISISILKAALTIDAHDAAVNYTRGGASSATITLTNGGNGALDSILFFIKQNSLLVTDSVKANGQLATYINTVGDTLFYRLRSVHFPGGTLDNGESITVTRYFHAPECYPSTGTAFPSFQSVYYANFGRNEERCQSPTPSDFGQINFSTANNGDPVATVAQLGIDRFANSCQTALVRYRYTAGCSGNADFCNAYNIYFLLWNGASGAGSTGWPTGGFSIKAIKLISNGASIPFVFTNQYSINLLNSAAVQGTDPDGSSVGLEDLDGDGYFDDIAPGSSFDIEIEWERLKPAVCVSNGVSHRMYLRGHFFNQCGQQRTSAQVGINNGNLYPSGSILMLSSPPELGAGQTGTTQTQINRFGTNNLYLSCPTNQFSIRFPVAPGMTVTAMRAGATNLSFSVVSDTAVAIIPPGASNPFISEVDFTVTVGVTPSGTRPSVILAYECTSACPNAREDISCIDGPPIIIPVPGPCPDGGATTSNSSILRMTTGYTTFQHTARVPLANISLPSRKRGLPCDSVLVSSTGTVDAGLVITGGEPLYYQVSYSLHGGVNRLFNWVGGTYTYQSTTSALPTPIYEADDNGMHIAIYSLGAFPAGAEVNIALYGVAQDAASLTNTLESVPGFGNTFFNLDDGFSNPAPGGDLRYSCAGQGLEFYVRNPRGAFNSAGFNTHICDNLTITSKRYFLRGLGAIDVDYFPGEIRPMILLDSIVVTMPTGWSYVPGSDVLRVWGNSNEGGFPANSGTGVSQNIGPGMVMGDKIKWVNPGNWNVPDDAAQGGFELTFLNDRLCTVTSTAIPTVFYGKQNANTRDLTTCPVPVAINNGGTGINTVRPAFTVTNLTGTQTADQRIECFDFNLRLIGVGASTVVNSPFTYIYFPGGGANFTVTSFENTITNVSYPILDVAGGQWVQLGTLQNPVGSGTSFPFSICASYASCTNPDIQYTVSWGCDGYPTDPAISGCSSVSGFFDLTPVPSGIQAQFISQPTPPVALCDPLVYDFNTLSTLAADLVDPRLDITIPTGMTLSTVEIEYPYNSGNFETVTPSGTTGTITIPYGLHSAVRDSLPGVNFAIMPDLRTGRMRLSFQTDCDFTSGDRLLIAARGNEPCGAPAQGDNTLVYSDPIDIAGVTQNYVTLVNNLNIGPDNIITCENRTVSMDMVIINTSAFPVTLDPTQDSVKIDLPAGIQYVAGSYNCTSGSNCFLSPIVHGSTLNLTFPVPSGVTIPASSSITVSFSIQINALIDEGCDVPGGLTISMVRSFLGVGCASEPSGVCPNPVKFITGSSTVEIMPQKANITNLEAIVCRTSANNYTYDGSFRIDAGQVPAGQDLLVEIFCLSGGSPAGAPVATQTISGALNMGSGAIPISGSFTTTCGDEAFRVRIAPVSAAGNQQCACAEVLVDVTLSNPTFAVANGVACEGDNSADITLSAITNGGNQYRVNFDDPAITDVTTATAIPGNRILSLPIPTNLAANTYTGTVVVINSTTGCEGSMPFSFVIRANPTVNTPIVLCLGTTQIVLGSGTPAATNPYLSSNAALATVNSAGTLTALMAGTLNVTYTDDNGCQAVSAVTVNPLPTLTGGSVCVNESITLTGSGTPAAVDPYTSSNPAVATVTSGGIVMGVSQGMATITYTDDNGCEATATVTVNPLPTLADASVCVGNTVVVIGSGIPNSTMPYTSSNTAVATVNNGGTVTGVSAGTAIITYTNLNGCQTAAAVTVNDTPTLIGGSVCTGSTITLTGSGTPAAVDPYVSSNTAVATISSGGVVTGLNAGMAPITYTDNNGCQATAMVTVAAAPTADAGTDQTVCGAAVANISATANGAGMWTGGTGTFGDATMSSTTYTPAIAEIGTTVTLTWTTTAMATCVDAADMVDITFAELGSAAFVPVPADCVGTMPNNNGRIVMTAHTGIDRYGISVPGAVTYSGNGPDYASAATVPATLPFDILTGVPNVGATYIVRIFSGSDACFTDYTLIVPDHSDCPTDLMGYAYCEETGQIIMGGSITVSGPGTVLITKDGTTGEYQFFTDGTVGTYTMTYTPPLGYALSTAHLPLASIDPTGQPNPYLVGAGSSNATALDDFTPGANPYTFRFDLEPGDPEIQLNNIPLSGCCLVPNLVVVSGAVCRGSSIDLATLVTSSGGGILSYHTTRSDAESGTNALPSGIVSPSAAQHYYVRSQTAPDCYTVRRVTITIQADACGPIGVSGPN